MKHKATIAALIADQIKWIEQHGGSLPGYVARYGAAQDSHRFGEGGEAIYSADRAALDRLIHASQKI